MKITVGKYVLFDDSDGLWTISGTSGQIERLIQQVAPLRAAAVRTIQRGVKATNLSFEVSRPAESEAELLKDLLFHESKIPNEGTIKFEGRESGGGSQTLYLQGHVQSVAFRFSGRRAFHTYRIIGGAISKDPPSA